MNLIRTKIIACVCLAFVFEVRFAAEVCVAEQPNVIVIISDDAGYADFGFMDGLSGETSEVPTPNLDALAARGVKFSNAYTATVCSPSRAALTTGGYQQRQGYEYNIKNLTSSTGPFEGLPVEATTIWERMKSVGYTTSAVGKWHIGSIAYSSPTEPGNRPERQGVDEFYGQWRGSRSYNVGTETHSTRVLRETLVDGFGNVTDTVVEGVHSGENVTETYGQFAVDFIADHHDDADPFFLYQSFTAPHTPLNESPDFNDPRLAGLSGNRKKYASMMLTMDDEIGRILDKLDDPDNNPATDNGITDDTLIVFINDNGGASSNTADNGQLRGFKGSAYEGGIRVPMIIAGAGVNAAVEGSIYDAPVHSIDILPTAFAAGGGSFGPNDTGIDGVNLLPFINGTITTDPHEVIAVRANTKVGVRKGDWKLVKAAVDSSFELYNLASDVGESTNVSGANPSIVAELQRDLTDLEAEFDKPRFPGLNQGTDSLNLFDHFTCQPGQGNWSASGAWYEGGTTNVKTMFTADAFAGAILEFPTTDSSSYVSSNDMTRSTGLDFMLNTIVLSGTFAGASNQSATIEGNDLLLVDNLQGGGPTIRLDSTNSTAAEFTYNIDTNLILYDNLTVMGNSGGKFNINGDIRDFFAARSVTKTGTSSVTLTGNSSFGGTLTIQGGEVVLAGGILAVGVLDNSAGGTFLFNGGMLQTPSVQGDLTNNGGTFSPGNSPAFSTVTGNYTQTTGTLAIEIEGLIAGSDFDVLQITGDLTAAGTLEVLLGGSYAPQVGQMFEVVTANSVSGSFLLDAPTDLDGNDIFAIHHNADSIVLEVLSSFLLVDGDLTFDGLINELDWQVLRPNLYVDTSGLTLGEARQLGDFNADLLVDRSDFLIFKDLFNGANGAGAFEAMVKGVPEPTSIWLVTISCLALASAGRVRSNCSY
jgi:autotransporter-associated beta strand protein